MKTPLKRTNQRRTARDAFDAIAFIAICALPLLLTILGVDGSLSRVELRKPSELPDPPRTIRQWKKYSTRLEAYINDHFGGRPELIRLNSLLRLSLGVSGSPEVVVGRDGWLFLRRNADVLDKHRGLMKFSQADLYAWVQEYEWRRKWLLSKDIKLFFFIVPNKHSIYGEHLPSRYQSVATTPTDQLVRSLRKHGVPGVVDLRAALSAAKQRHQQVYTKMSTHWNDMGAFEGYKSIITSLRQNFPSMNVLKAEDISYAIDYGSGELSRLIGLPNDLKESISTARVGNSAVTEKEGEHYRTTGITVKSSHSESPAALILCDSFTGDFCYKFLQESFRWTHFRHHRGMAFSTDIVKSLSPDVVIYIVVERLIPLRLGRKPAYSVAL